MHGGDSSVSDLAKALFEAALHLPEDVDFALCGNRKALQTVVQNQRPDSLRAGRFLIFDAPDTTSPTPQSLSRYWRNHPDNSLIKALSLQKEGLAQASLSAGDTGLLLTSALFLLERQEGVERPALAAPIPTRSGGSALLLDVGANIECKSQHLVNFANLGHNHIQKLGAKTPTVRLLNIGSEEYKGTSTILAAHKILLESSLNYQGFIEAHEIVEGKADIVVCDGFNGNIYLKSAESILRFMVEHISSTLSDQTKTQLALFSSEMYGAVPILGLKGTVYKAHGSSSTNALTQSIITAVKTVY